jgi:hypothetical protein
MAGEFESSVLLLAIAAHVSKASPLLSSIANPEIRATK